jgi:hypothetical protein
MSIRITALTVALAAACGVAAAEELSTKTWTNREGDQTTLRSGQPDMRDFGPPPDFASLDRNGDGAIDAGESHGYQMLYIDFEFADHNRDKRVSQREYARWVQGGASPEPDRR